MEELPIDVINYLAIDMNISDVINLCKTSKKFQDNICNNKNYWINRLKRDYDIAYEQSFGDPKTLYIDVKKYFSKLNQIYDINKILEIAAENGNINMIRIAIIKGADVNRYELEYPMFNEKMIELFYKNVTESPEAITNAVLGGHVESLKYLLPLLKRQLTKKQLNNLLGLAVEYGGIKMVRYLMEDMKIKFDSRYINSAKFMLSEYSDMPERFAEQKEVIKYLKQKMF